MASCDISREARCQAITVLQSVLLKIKIFSCSFIYSDLLFLPFTIDLCIGWHGLQIRASEGAAL